MVVGLNQTQKQSQNAAAARMSGKENVLIESMELKASGCRSTTSFASAGDENAGPASTLPGRPAQRASQISRNALN